LKYTVVTITKDDLNGLLITLQSILNQSHKDIEVIIVYSGFDVSCVVDWFPDLDITLIFQSGYGIYNAFNLGHLNASGVFLSVLNSGDEFSSHDSVIKLVQTISSTNNMFDVYISPCVYKYKKLSLIRSPKINNNKLISFPAHSAVAISRRVYSKQLYNEDFYFQGDVEFLMRIFSNYSFFLSCYPLTIFTLGGVSNFYPNFLTVSRMEHDCSLLNNNLICFFKYKIRFFVSRLFGKNLFLFLYYIYLKLSWSFK